MPEEAGAAVAEDLFAEEVGSAAIDGVAAVESAAPGSIAMGIEDTAGTVFEPAVAGGAAGAAAGAATTPSGPPPVAGPTGAGVLDSLKTAATVLAPVASMIGAVSGLQASNAARKAALGGSSVGGVAPPVVAPPVAMPTVGTGSKQTQAIQRTTTQELFARRGRASTILTAPPDSGDKLGD